MNSNLQEDNVYLKYNEKDFLEGEETSTRPPLHPNSNNLKYEVGIDIKDKSNYKGMTTYCKFYTCLLLSIILVACYITYIIWGILVLVNNYDISHNCNGSNLWAYALITMILSCSRLKFINTDKQKMLKFICCSLFLGLLEAGLAVWGGFELYHNSCQNINDSGLWKFSFLSLCIQSVFGTIFLLLIPLYMCISTYF